MEGSISRETPLKENPESNRVYVCTQCGTVLFEADKRFAAGCGFPSFWLPAGNNVRENLLHTYGRTRTQLLCNTCGAHLGHLFPSRQTPTGVRYCINEQAIPLQAR